MKTCKKSVFWMSLYITLTTITFIACDTKEEMLGDRIGDPMADSVELADFYVGADLSYTSELEKIGVKYTLGGEEMDVYSIFKTYGANMVKLRLWNSPINDKPANMESLVESAHRVQSAGMSLLIDLYYSDSWTVTEKNTAPAAWTSIVNVPEVMADSVYKYTYNTLMELEERGITPAAVQIGANCDENVLVLNSNHSDPLDVKRNVMLLNASVKAINDFNKKCGVDVKSVLCMALENVDVLKLMDNYKEAGLYFFDVLGVSYYPQLYVYSIEQVRRVASDLYKKYGVRLLLSETGCIWTKRWNDESPNLLNTTPKLAPDVASPHLQRHFFLELKRVMKENYGYGVLAWEPEWVSSQKRTRWGVGSSVENAAFFDFNNEVLLNGGMDFLNDNNGRVTFSVDMSGAGENKKGYITGSFTDDGAGKWSILPMERIGDTDVYIFKTYMSYNQTLKYYYLSDSTWTSKERMIRECTLPYGVKIAKRADVWNVE
mgnify:FL=1